MFSEFVVVNTLSAENHNSPVFVIESMTVVFAFQKAHNSHVQHVVIKLILCEFDRYNGEVRAKGPVRFLHKLSGNFLLAGDMAANNLSDKVVLRVRDT